MGYRNQMILKLLPRAFLTNTENGFAIWPERCRWLIAKESVPTFGPKSTLFIFKSTLDRIDGKTLLFFEIAQKFAAFWIWASATNLLTCQVSDFFLTVKFVPALYAIRTMKGSETYRYVLIDRWSNRY